MMLKVGSMKFLTDKYFIHTDMYFELFPVRLAFRLESFSESLNFFSLLPWF